MSTETDTHTGRVPCEDEDRDGSDAFTSQGTPKLPSNRQKLGGGHGADSPTQCRRNPLWLTT